MDKKNKFTYSKWLPITTGIVFIICLAIGFSVDASNVYDVSIFVTAISVSGAIWGTCIVNYSKKASSENAYKMKSAFYKEATRERLYFNEQMMILKQKYSMTDEDVMNIDESGESDEVMSNAFDDATSSLNANIEESETVSDIQSFGL